MSSGTGIQWTSITWNPTTGCDKISAGCDNCYAMTLAKRLKAMGQAKYQNDGDPRTSGPGFALTAHSDALVLPYGWTGTRLVFVNSMSDLFHARVPLDFIRQVFQVIANTPQHTYQILTKRSTRLRRLTDNLDWPPNLWMGVSVEDAGTLVRVDHLRAVSGANVAGFIMGTALFSMFLMLTLYMQQVLGYSPMKTGVAYLAHTQHFRSLIVARSLGKSGQNDESGQQQR